MTTHSTQSGNDISSLKAVIMLLKNEIKEFILNITCNATHNNAIFDSHFEELIQEIRERQAIDYINHFG